MTPTPMLDLASEVLIKILENLHFTDILSCMQTCKTILDIVNGSPELNYRIQLQIAGLQDNPRCRLSLAERHSQLKGRERRWNSFEWKTASTFPIPHNTSNLFEITPSTVVMGIAPDENERGTKGLQIAQLNTLSVHAEEGESVVSMLWKDFMFGTTILEVGVAIEEHDLIACIVSVPSEINSAISELLVYLFRYSTKDWHDACKVSILRLLPMKEADGTPKFTIEISGENLALTIMFGGTAPEDRMFVYDWKTGRNKTPDGEPIMNGGLVFLQEDIIAHPNAIRKSIDLYHIPSSEDFSSNSGTKVRLIRQLLLPEAPFQWFITSFEVRSSPNPTDASACPGFISENRPFTNDPIHATVFLSMTMYRDIRDFALFTHRKALLDLVPWERTAPEYSSKFSGGISPFDDLPWEQWGPPVTRWFSQHASAQVTTTSGQRYAITMHAIEDPSKEYPDGRPTRNIQLINFNPWTVKMARQGLLEGLAVVGGDEKDLGGEELKENVCSASDVFSSDIVGRLPYVCTIKSVEWTYAAAMMNEEMLLG